MVQHQNPGALGGGDVKRVFGSILTLLLVLGPLTVQAHASDYDGRDRDGGWSYRHHRGDDGRGYRDDGGDGNGYSGDQSDRCRSGGCDNRSRRCDRSSGDCRSSFSPGPFKDSPVYICAPYSCNSGGQQSGSNDGSGGDGGGSGKQPPGSGKKPPQEETSLACLVPAPYHCDPKP